jgi:hypothetical protein
MNGVMPSPLAPAQTSLLERRRRQAKKTIEINLDSESFW